MRIAIAGLGTIGRVLARRLADGMPGLTLACVAARDEEKARGWLDEEGIEAPIVPLEEFPEHADLAVECAPAAVLEQICRPMLAAGKQVMVLSCGALLPRPELLELAKAARRAHHRADRRPARARCRRGGGRGHDPFGAHDDAQAAERARRRAASREERNLGRRTERSRSSCSPAPRAMPPPAFPPTSTWSRRSRSPASGRTAP